MIIISIDVVDDDAHIDHNDRNVSDPANIAGPAGPPAPDDRVLSTDEVARDKGASIIPSIAALMTAIIALLL